jgi:hypothetical protein
MLPGRTARDALLLAENVEVVRLADKPVADDPGYKVYSYS